MRWLPKAYLVVRTRALASGGPVGPTSSAPTAFFFSKKGSDNGGNLFQCNYLWYKHNLRAGHTWRQPEPPNKLSSDSNSAQHGQPRGIDHVLIDGRSFSRLKDVCAVELTIFTHETCVDEQSQGHRMAIAKLRCRWRKPGLSTVSGAPQG